VGQQVGIEFGPKRWFDVHSDAQALLLSVLSQVSDHLQNAPLHVNGDGAHRDLADLGSLQAHHAFHEDLEAPNVPTNHLEVGRVCKGLLALQQFGLQSERRQGSAHLMRETRHEQGFLPSDALLLGSPEAVPGENP
jgi:hypothetical protein